MPDEFFTRTMAAPRRGAASLRALIGISLLTFVGGALLVGYLVWNGRISIGADKAAPSANLAAPPSPAASTAAVAVGGFDQRIAALEQRLSRIDLQAAAAEGNSARAEALLVAFATRRAIERGAPLGYLADQLKLRFGEAQPGAVQIVLEAAKTPNTLDQLTQQLDMLGPALADAPQGESGWDSFSRELGSLFVIRHGETPSTRPEDRLGRARLLLRTGQVDAAADEVARMPGSPAATAWIASARRYAATGRALDLIETTALTAPNKLRTASGQPAPQPSPVPAPASKGP